MGTRTITETVTLIPSSYSNQTNLSATSSYPITNGYADENNTSYTRFTVSQNATGYIFYIFDASAIPANATITSVSAKAHVRINNTSRVTDTKCQLFNGTGILNAKGSNSTFASTSTSYVVTLDAGSWTRSELNDIRLKIGGTGYNGTSSRYIYFYGASVTVTYTYTVTTYDVTVQNSTSATVTVDKSTPIAGEDVVITTDRVSGITIKDNNVDITSQFQKVTTATETCTPNNQVSSSGFTVTDLSNAFADADSNDYATLSVPSGGSSCSLSLYFDTSGVPSGATIVSVSCKATFQYNRNNSSSRFSATCQMYKLITAVGSPVTIVSSGGSNVAKTTFTFSDAGTWSSSDLGSATFYVNATNNANSTTRYLYLYGVSFDVTYEIDGNTYVYTISNIAANHTITVTSGASTQTIYYKENGTWKSADTVYKKVNGSWVLQNDLSTVFNAQTNYVKGN